MLEDWFNPTWFASENLSRTWIEGRFGAKAVRFLMICVALLLCTSVVTIPVAIYLDSVGLDILVSIVELQIIVGVALYLDATLQFFGRWIPVRSKAKVRRRMSYFRLTYQRLVWLCGSSDASTPIPID